MAEIGCSETPRAVRLQGLCFATGCKLCLARLSEAFALPNGCADA